MTDQPAGDREELQKAIERSNTQRLRFAAEIRSGGRTRYVWRYALVRVWLPVAIAIAVGLTFLAPSTEPPAFGAAPSLVGWLAILLPAGTTIGVLWGFRMWRRFERHWFPLLDRASGDPAAPT